VYLGRNQRGRSCIHNRRSCTISRDIRQDGLEAENALPTRSKIPIQREYFDRKLEPADQNGFEIWLQPIDDHEGCESIWTDNHSLKQEVDILEAVTLGVVSRMKASACVPQDKS
jgi:hypothetical protein